MPVFTITTCPSRRARLVALAAIALGLSAGSAAATPTDADLLTNFNLIASGNATTSSDVVGAMLVGGTVGGNGTIDQSGAQPGGTVSQFGGINAYGATPSNAGNTASGVTVDLAAGSYGGLGNAATVNTNVAFPYTFSSIWTQLTQLSTALGSLGTTTNSSISLQQNTPSITAGAATVNGVANVAVLNITGAQWNTLNNEGGQVSMNLGASKLLVVNVNCAGAGNACGGTGNTNYNGQSWGSDVLWNFIGATSINFGLEFAGSVLAVDAAVSNSNDIDGTLVASSFDGSSELHDEDELSSPGLLDTFPSGVSGSQTPVPEPSSLALLAAALVGFAWVRRRQNG